MVVNNSALVSTLDSPCRSIATAFILRGVEPILGYRTLSVRDDQIYSPFESRFEWKRGTIHAACDEKPPCRQIPGLECGIYAYHHLDDALDHTVYRSIGVSVVVAVIGFGFTKIHSDRWRSASARVVGVLQEQEQPRREELTVSSEFGVPLLAAEALAEHASEFGATRYKYGQPPPHPSPQLGYGSWDLSDVDPNLPSIEW